MAMVPDWETLAAPMQLACRRWLWVWRSVSESTDLTAFVVFAPQAATLADAGQSVGTRWTTESSCETTKGEVSLEHSEVRSWVRWYRHITLAM
jgi:SRSO17 transposase